MILDSFESLPFDKKKIASSTNRVKFHKKETVLHEDTCWLYVLKNFNQVLWMFDVNIEGIF